MPFPNTLTENSEKLFSKVFGTLRLTDNQDAVRAVDEVVENAISWYDTWTDIAFTLTYVFLNPSAPWYIKQAASEFASPSTAFHDIHRLRTLDAYTNAPERVRLWVENIVETHHPVSGSIRPILEM